ncbi:MAG: MFS transporter [Acidobacteriota bacterium]
MTLGRFSRWNPWRGLSGLPREVWILFIATLVNKAGSMVLPFFVLYLTRDAGFSARQASFLVLLYGSGSLCGALLSGKLSDAVGPIRIMRGSLLGTGVILFAFPYARSLPAIAAMTVLLAFVAEAFRPANLTIIGDLVVPEIRKTAFAVNRLAINLGMSIGPALGGLLATISFRWLFLVDGATALAAGAILAASAFPAHHAQAEDPLTRAAGDLVRHGSAHRDRRLLFFLAALLPIDLVFFQHISSMPLYLVENLKLTAAAYGILFSVNTVLVVLCEVPVNRATAHWPHRRTLGFGALLVGAGFGALAFAWDIWSVAATVVIWTFGEMLLFPGMADYLTDIAPPRRRGEYMGLAQMSVGLAFAVGPWGGLQALARYGGRTLWLGALACGLLSAGMLATVRGNRDAKDASASVREAEALQPEP